MKMTKGKNIKKVCSFCVSDWHFITMLIPYLHKKMMEQADIKMCLENSEFEVMRIFLSKLTLKEEEKQQLADLNWNQSRWKHYQQFEAEMEKIAKEDSVIIVKGEKSYIERINHYVYKWNRKNGDKYNNITVVNCYQVLDCKETFEEILKEHEMILNTAGEQNIKDVFEKEEQEVS